MSAGRLKNLPMCRTFPCAGRTVRIALSALRTMTREPTFEVIWIPSRPERLTPQDILTFDRARLQCMAELRDELHEH